MNVQKKITKVFCLDDECEYIFSTGIAYEALKNMEYLLNLTHLDKNAHIDLHNGRTLALTHNNKVYACLLP